uniref:PDH_E1_M domain-containing protein n=1 Tax=Steinernema glaseri TaxID=37863 RepID=A0A1I7XYN2_9BILA
VPALEAFDSQLKGTGDRAISTTMAFVRILGTLLKDPQVGRLVVPIVPDESRTFGMEGLFRQIGIHSHVGQLYTPQDAGTLSYYKESTDGQIMQEGLNESGATSSWIAASTAYANHGVMTLPFYIFYSMFGFQRDGMRRMYAEQEDVYYYITVLNENYAHPAMPEGAEQGILKGLYRLAVEKPLQGERHVQLMGSGSILNEVLAAADI